MVQQVNATDHTIKTTAGIPLSENITVPQSVWDSLESAISFGTDADKRKFLADAMNTYVQLGQMVQSGCKVLLKKPAASEPPQDYVNLVFPFETAEPGDASARDTAAE